MNSASFVVDVTPDDAQAFARLSGDWNPLHTDAAYAASTAYRTPILHGAFSAGLVSRMAGMHLPGRHCLLHAMRLRFVAPIHPPATLEVKGTVTSASGESGRVETTVSDARTGTRYVDAVYEFSLHEEKSSRALESSSVAPTRRWMPEGTEAPVLVTGATGGLGRAVSRRLAPNVIQVSRQAGDGLLQAENYESLARELGDTRIGGIVHCGWPAPDNRRLIDAENPAESIDHHLAAPLRQILSLARLLVSHGTDDAMLVLVGSTAADPGRHNFRAPLYSLAKGVVPDLARILALELGASGRRCAALVYDVIEGGMNERLSPTARIAHSDRAPSGRLPSPADAAEQIAWVLGNSSFLLSGATINVSGGAIP